MNKEESGWLASHPLVAFFLLAYLFSWGVQVPLALQATGFLDTKIPFSLHYLSGYGPLLAAFIVTWRSTGRAGIRELLGGVSKWRIRPIWWLVAFSPLLALILISMASWLVQGKVLSIDDLGRIDHFPAIGLGTLPFWILTFGLGEETGWRGFALPRLQEGRRALSATLILWALWALWHLPLFFYKYEPSMLPGFSIGLLAGAIIFSWIYNNTGGSVLMTILWHGSYNYGTACSRCKIGASAPIISALAMIGAVVIVLSRAMEADRSSISEGRGKSDEESIGLSGDIESNPPSRMRVRATGEVADDIGHPCGGGGTAAAGDACE